jgi:hypothetical protein
MNENLQVFDGEIVRDFVVGVLAAAAAVSVVVVGASIGGGSIDSDLVGVAALNAVSSLSGIVHGHRSDPFMRFAFTPFDTAKEPRTDSRRYCRAHSTIRAYRS